MLIFLVSAPLVQKMIEMVWGHRQSMLGLGSCLKNSAALLKAPKPYNFPIEHASDMSMRLVFVILGHTSSQRFVDSFCRPTG